MALLTVRFNKTKLLSLVHDGQTVIVKDSEVNGLKFKVGQVRTVFQFEKRISGCKGSPITVTIGAFPIVSIDEARQEARRLANLCEKGLDPRRVRDDSEPLSLTVQAALDKFFQIKAGVSFTTMRGYRQVARNQFPKRWLKLELASITPEMLVDQFHEIRKTARKQCWYFLKTFGNIWNSCAPYYKDARGKRLLGVNPIPEARLMLQHIVPDTPKRTVIPKSALGKFVVSVERLRGGTKRADNTQLRLAPASVAAMCDIVLLSLFTGFRFNEARHLKWDYIDLERGLIHLPGKVFSGQGEFEGTKNHQDHWIPLCTYAWSQLRTLRQSRTSASPYVFPSPKDPSKPAGRYCRVFRRIAELMGSPFSPHATRRTFASAANEAGIGFLAVKRMLNHAYQGGVTGGYIVPGFNPEKERVHFQKVCDFILERRAEYLGQKTAPTHIDKDALLKLKRYALNLGIDPLDAFEALKQERDEALALAS